MSNVYLIIHMHDIDPYGHRELFNQVLDETLKDSEIVDTIVQDSMPDDMLEPYLKEIIRDRTDIIPVLVYSDYGYQLRADPTDLVYMSALTTILTGNRAKSISYTYSDLNRKRNQHFYLEFC